MVRGTRLVSLAAGVALATAGGDVFAAPKELGLNIHQSDTVGVAAAHDAGVGWVRVDFNWLDAEPAQGTYDWTRFDALVDAAVAKNLKVLAVVAYGPAWASSGDTKGDGPNNDVPNDGAYAAFVTAVVSRYQAKVTHYELWNEPNLEQFFEGTPQQYLDRVLVPGADALHAACATCKVVGPGLATVGTAYADWMEAVLANAASKLDVVSGHIYASFPDGSGSGAGFTSDSFFNKLEDHRVIKLGSATVYRIAGARAARGGRGEKEDDGEEAHDAVGSNAHAALDRPVFAADRARGTLCRRAPRRSRARDRKQLDDLDGAAGIMNGTALDPAGRQRRESTATRRSSEV